MRRPLAVLIAMLTVGGMAWSQDRTVRDVTDAVEITAPVEWSVQQRAGHIGVTMPTDGTVYAPTVNITVERLEGPRKRLDNYVNMFYAEQHAHMYTPSDWSMRDTTFLGLKGKVIEYTMPYAGEELRTRMVVSIEGDKAFALRMMWLTTTSDAERAALRRVASTVHRITP